MLELKDIRKTYITKSEKVEALKGINLKFRESEFVSILGQSGCGKTTLLNIVGGLDRYTSGDLIINGKSTKKFKDRDWDAYRNYKVGFIFQSYNLINHQTVLSNVELALTIGGIPSSERKQRAIKALEEVGLKEHIHKKPNQLSGGQMQRVAIARALVNNPDIILADEPTGALDTKTSVQVMDILKKISKNKLIIMVTHNPELAEKYSNRIIKILDGKITEDSNPITKGEHIEENPNTNEIGRTKMSFWTAFRLSLNNLLTKKTRTILVSFAGSIGIIGIALVQSLSNGFQSYIDTIQEDALTSYPLTIMQETTDVAGALLSMKPDESSSEDGTIREEQYISKLLANLSTNDLKSFKKHLENNYNEIEKDISTIKYGYSVEPLIYTIDETDKLSKLNPSNLFSSSSFGMGMMSSYTSIYSQMMDNTEKINESYDILAGRLPEKYNEMIIVLTDKNSISDLLVYSLGLRDTEELKDIVTKIMNGEKADINNKAKTFTYEDLLNTELKLVMPSKLYKYNKEYDIYEDMSQDEEYMEDVYNDSIDLKIVGIVSAKKGVTTAALNPGISYTSKLIDYIIDYSSRTDIVEKQLEDEDIDVLSGKRFDEPKKGLGIDFTDLVSVDSSKLKSAFSFNINTNQIESKIQEESEKLMDSILDDIKSDLKDAKKDFLDKLESFSKDILDKAKELKKGIENADSEEIVKEYLNKEKIKKDIAQLQDKYGISAEELKKTYSGLLNSLLELYTKSYKSAQTMIDNISKDIKKSVNNTTIENITKQISNTINTNTIKNNLPDNNTISEKIKEMLPEDVDISEDVLKAYMSSAAIQETAEAMFKEMTNAFMKRYVLNKVSSLTSSLANSFASSFNVNPSKIQSAFKMKMDEDQLTRIIKSMLNETKANAKTNLIKFGYQEKEEPTYISFYFNSFDGKENFLDFIESYNDKQKANNKEDKVINYSDTTGILMNSVKIIVNAVTYVLIAFISISLIVSSIMIGIITYISVYERTKEIGILRAIGASKHNISSIFNAETFIIGLLSGLFGIGITLCLIPIVNAILHHFAEDVPINAILYPANAITLIILSIILTLIGGLIPAKSASKKDPVIALRTE